MKTAPLLKIETFPIGSLACNCSIIYSPETKEAIAIDPGNDAEAFLRKVKELGVTVKALLHTHAHFDHIGQSNSVKKMLNVPIYLHKDDLFLYENLPQQGRFFGLTLDEPAALDGYIEDESEWKIHLLGSELKEPTLQAIVKSIHTPGHTPGSCSFLLETHEKPVLFSGDTLFLNSIGRTDLPGGDFDTLIRSIKKRLFTLPEETQVIPGHGAFTSLYKEKRANPFLF